MADITDEQKTWHVGEEFLDLTNSNIAGPAENLFPDLKNIPRSVVWVTNEQGPYLYYWKVVVDDLFTPPLPLVLWQIDDIYDQQSNNNGLIRDKYTQPLSPPTSIIKLGQKIRCVSKPHNLDMMFTVKALSIPLNAPESTSYSLGEAKSVSLSDIVAHNNAKVNSRIDKVAKNSRTPTISGGTKD